MGRNLRIKDDEKVVVCSERASTKLQRGSERRAVLNAIVDHGGCMTMLEINNKFGFDCRSFVGSLIVNGWLKISEES